MNKKSKILRAGIAGSLLAVLATLGFAASALAHEGEFAKFNYCPSTNTEVKKCIYAVTEGGQVVLGKKTTPIVNPVTLQGGISAPNGENVSTFYGATNGETLSKAPQPVPGGLAGLVKCDEISEPVARLLCELVFENGVTGVNATLELARPASEIQLSEHNLVYEEGTALKLPVKVHLENPLLGNSCYVGSSSAPLIWNLTTGETKPPAPYAPLVGSAGTAEFLEGGLILHITENVLVENDWAAPKAEGCGGLLAAVIDPVIDSEVGLPAEAGENEAILDNTIDTATATAVNKH